MKPSSKFTPKVLRREKSTMSSSSESGGEMKDPVQVYCRLRPMDEEKQNSCITLLSPTVLSLIAPADSKILRKDVQYVFKHIFTSHASQKEMFVHIALPLLEDLVNGKNGLLFTYGVTGSGKTFTLTGDTNNPGIMPQCINTLFNSIGEYQSPKYVIKSNRMNGFEIQSDNDALEDRMHEAKFNSRAKLTKKPSVDKIIYANDGTKINDVNETNLYSIFISYTEIYNNTVYDLLDESEGKTLQGKILREDPQKNMYVNGMVEVEVKSAMEAFDLFNAGQRRKRMAHTVLNSESSRSHSIFNIRVVQLLQVAHNSHGHPMIPDGNLIKVGQLSLVDLAGSERCSRTQTTGVRLKEASSINNSLMSLRSCMEILRENQVAGANRLVPYRDSRLTLLFKNYFEGEGRVLMIVCANPAAADYEENLQVLKFAEFTQEVKVTRGEIRYTPQSKVQKQYRGMSGVSTPSAKKAKLCSTMLPKIPLVKFNFENFEECASSIANLAKILKIRQEKDKQLQHEISGKEKSIRKRLMDINQENVVTKSELMSIKALIKKEKQKYYNVQMKLTDMESTNVGLSTKNDELQNVIIGLRHTIDEKDLRINQNLLNREKTKQKLAMQTEKLNQELDDKLRRQRNHLHAAMQAKDCKLQKVREILDAENVLQVGIAPGNMETQIQTQTEQNVEKDTTQRFGQRRNVQASSARRRRSRSVGEVWLEHNAVKPVALGTVMQPSMKRRKSITKLTKARDVTNQKQNKYCLLAQETDTDGELETKLYKADILPTCGGGAQVIFNDVERLRQESPSGTPRH